jgi:hypothetical protein
MRRSLRVLQAAYLASLDRLPFVTHRVVVVFLAALVATLALFGAVRYINDTDWPIPEPRPAATSFPPPTRATTTRPAAAPTTPGGSGTVPPAGRVGTGAGTARPRGSGGPAGAGGPAPATAPPTTRAPANTSPPTITTPTTAGVTVSVCVPGVTCVTVP